jgi:hypothetical protein
MWVCVGCGKLDRFLGGHLLHFKEHPSCKKASLNKPRSKGFCVCEHGERVPTHCRCGFAESVR